MREKLEKVPRLTLQDGVYDRLRQGLMQGRFPPGDVLLIRSLAEEMGTSIMPVREALQRLVAERALRLLPNRSVEVPKISQKEFETLIAIRLQLEGMAAEMAAPLITDKVIGNCATLNKSMKKAIAKNDERSVLHANSSFHFELYSACGSDFLVSLIESLWLRAGPLLALPFQRFDTRSAMFRGGTVRHDDLLVHLRRRDAAAAQSTLQQDIATAATWYIENHVFASSRS